MSEALHSLIESQLPRGRVETLFDEPLANVRTPDLISLTCSIERLIEHEVYGANRQPTRRRLSVVADRHLFVRCTDRPLPQEVTMSATFATPTSVRRPTARRASTHPAVRLTRRGQIVLVSFALLLMLGVGVALGTGSAATDDPAPSGATETVRVAAGDTLWEIAAERAGGSDVQGVIDEIRSLNAMSTGSLQAGQLLLVPAS
ncbi:LysM peptidoglycan-binding domain-containing protein [Nocardioides alkalitolerans]|uniref:LysM peptidoglycan-binding domain-containing protein n=1 Tax=Nocardioides alkalitolerans TaxID=281714 RepID=UPI0012FB85E3|nr:LysM peptidoglycan-binding domain-containing protein [Nocardioides alkalitolerans]